MSILLPVNPPYAGMLVDGLKTIEWRRKPLPEGTAYIYETKKKGGSGLIIGEVYIGDNIEFPCVSDIPLRYLDKGIIDSPDMRDYIPFGTVYGNEVHLPIRYTIPLPLNRFRLPCNWKYDCCTCKLWNPDKYEAFCKRAEPLTRPPQSWCYCEDLKEETVTEEGSKSK